MLEMVIASPTNYRCTIKYEPQNDRFCLLKKLNIRILIAQPSFISLIHRCKNTQTSQLILHLPLNMMTVHLHVLTVLYTRFWQQSNCRNKCSSPELHHQIFASVSQSVGSISHDHRSNPPMGFSCPGGLRVLLHTPCAIQ